MKKLIIKAHGQAIVLITLLMIGMIAMLGLVFDGGNAYIHRRRMQNAADAGALAGGRALALANGAGDSSGAAENRVRDAIRNFVQSNGGSISASYLQMNFVNPQGQSAGIIGAYNGIPPNATGVSVTAAISFSTFFLSVVDIDNGNVGARALVQTGQPTGVSNLFPVAVPTGTLVTGALWNPSSRWIAMRDVVGAINPQSMDALNPGECQYNLADNPACQIWGETTGPGSNGWTNFKVCGYNGANYLKDVLGGSKTSGTVKIGDSICSATGSIDALKDSLLPWVGKDVVIPIYNCKSDEIGCPNYDNKSSGSNLKYHVAAFALFTFKGFDFSNNQKAGDINCNPATNKYLCGKFKRWASLATDLIPTKTCSYGFCGYQMWQ